MNPIKITTKRQKKQAKQAQKIGDKVMEFLKSKTGCDTIEEMVKSGEIEVAKWRKLKQLNRKHKGILYIWLLRSDFDEIQRLPTNEKVVAYIAKAKYIGIDASGQFKRFSGHMVTDVSPFDRFLRKTLQNDTHLTCIFFKKRSNLFKVFETVSVYMFRDMPFSEILNVNGSVVLSEKIANYDTDKFYAVLVWLMHEAVTNAIQTMHTTSKHSDIVRKRVAKEQIRPIAAYNDFIAKLVKHTKENGGEIACKKCLFGFNQYQTAVYIDSLIKTGAIRIVGKKIKWAVVIADEKEASDEENAVDEEVGQWWNLDDDGDEEEDDNDSGEANESSDSEDDDLENNNAPARTKANGMNTGKKSSVVKKRKAQKAPKVPKEPTAKNKPKPKEEKNDDGHKQSKLSCTEKFDDSGSSDDEYAIDVLLPKREMPKRRAALKKIDYEDKSNDSWEGEEGGGESNDPNESFDNTKRDTKTTAGKRRLQNESSVDDTQIQPAAKKTKKKKK